MSAGLFDDVDAGPRSKRAAILQAAIASFGEVGYEATKWATVADRVPIGLTALYHYFGSKAQCLLAIMRLELARSHCRFLEATAADFPAPQALWAALAAAFDVSDHEILQMRILQAKISLLGPPGDSVREKEERQASRRLVHEIEMSWTGLLERGMAAGQFPGATRTPWPWRCSGWSSARGGGTGPDTG